MAQNYENYFKRFESHSVFPELIKTNKRLLQPMASIDMHSRVMLPTALSVTSATIETVTAQLDDLFALMEVLLVDARRAFLTYIPYPAAGQDLWSAKPPGMDPLRLSGWYNSQVIPTDTFGDTGDPIQSKTMVCDESETNECLFYSLSAQVSWEEVGMSTIYQLTDDVTDDEFWMLTPHKWHTINFIDDLGVTTGFSGTPIVEGDAAMELYNFAYSRFALSSPAIERGLQMPGYTASYIAARDLVRVIELQNLETFSTETLRALNAQMTGSALRSRNKSVDDTLKMTS
jgi:hypothetical protein